ncbi:MAG: hypothetical protein ACLQPD_26370 [Desulfomonilaceae bacterium]
MRILVADDDAISPKLYKYPPENQRKNQNAVSNSSKTPAGRAMIRSNLIPDTRKIPFWETLNDDLKNGALGSVIIIALVCLAIILFGR